MPRDAKRDIQYILEENWDPEAITGRTPVPEPNIVVEGNEDARSVSKRREDVVFVMDGGSPVVDPASVGHMHEYIETVVDIQVFTSQGEERFYGEEGEHSYEGIVGEIKRILDMHRTGFDAYDRMDIDTFEDQIGEYGADRWVGTWIIRLYQYASKISQEANR